MFRLEEVLQLKDGEEIRMVVKRHAVTLIPKLLGALLLLAGPFFFLFPLFRTGPTGMVVFAVMVGTGTFIAWRSFVMWDGDVFIVSTHRIVKVLQTGIFSRVVTEAGVENIRDVAWMKKGIFGVVWNYGSVLMNIIGIPQPIIASFVPQPKQVHALVTDMMDMAKKRGLSGAGQERVTKADRVKKLLDDLSEDELRTLERKLAREERHQTVDRLFNTNAGEKMVSEHSSQEHAPADEYGLSIKKITAASLKEIDE